MVSWWTGLFRRPRFWLYPTECICLIQRLESQRDQRRVRFLFSLTFLQCFQDIEYFSQRIHRGFFANKFDVRTRISVRTLEERWRPSEAVCRLTDRSVLRSNVDNLDQRRERVRCFPGWQSVAGVVETSLVELLWSANQPGPVFLIVLTSHDRVP